MNALHSHKSVCHYTPVDIIQRVHASFGGPPDLDPATDAKANRDVQASEFYDSNGLERPWWGNVFCNPPGESAKWWHKMADERSRCWWSNSPFRCIFIGYSLEILQTVQPVKPHPLSYPFCVPAKRIQFDVDAHELLEKLNYEVQHLGRPLDRKVEKVENVIRSGQWRYPGTSPTHGNIIVAVSRSDDDEFIRAFKRNFAALGYVSR